MGFDVVRYGDVLPHGVADHISRTVRHVKPFTLTSTARLVALCEAVEHVARNRIPGDIVECGVWKGGSMMAVARTLLEYKDADRKLYLFDTFDGMTQPTDKDVTLDGRHASQLMAAERRQDQESVWCVAPLDQVKEALYGTGYDPGNLVFVQGRVEETIPACAPGKIALLRLDTDWYESTKHELEHLFSRLSRGGVLIIDDYGHWKGARQAVDEFMREQQSSVLLHRIDYSGRSAIKWVE